MREGGTTHTGLGRHGYRNHDLAFATLHGSARYLSRHLHIKLTHNARHISGTARARARRIRECATRTRRERSRRRGVHEGRK